MDGFSFGEALGSGFKVVGRNPLAVVAWGLVYLALVGAPAMVYLFHSLPNTLAVFQAAADGAPRPGGAASQLAAMRGQTAALQPLMWLVSIAVNGVIVSAVFRAVLQPEAKDWAYLRLGAQELWVSLTYLVMIVAFAMLFVLLAVPLAIGGGIVVGVAAQGHGSPLVGLSVVGALAVIGTAVIAWVMLRLCLALPMSFAERRFALYESWPVTRGHGLKMFGVFLVLAIGLLVVETALLAAVAGPLLAAAPHADAWKALAETWRVPSVEKLGPPLAAFALLSSLLGMALHAILVAPLAVMYRDLKGQALAA